MHGQFQWFFYIA